MRSSTISSCGSTSRDDFLFGLVEKFGSLWGIWQKEVNAWGEDTGRDPFEDEDPTVVSCGLLS
jgi:hypothetical protein